MGVENVQGIIDSAIHFTKEHKLRIFPIINGMPGLKRWPHLATTDEEQIRQWYKTERFDGFAVVGGDTTLIIDVDVKNGKNGAASLKELISEGLPKKTLVVRTKSGGLHIYFHHDLPYVKSVANLFPAIDIRGTKGYVIGPDQPHYNYQIVRQGPILKMPDTFQRMMPVEEVDKSYVTTEDLIVRGAETAGGVIPETIGAGERHDTLIRLMASWARKVPLETGKILLAEAIGRCEKGKEPVDYDEYEPRLLEAYGKFEPVNSKNMEVMLDTLVYVTNGDRIYDKVNRRSYKVSEARNLYRNAIQWKEETTGNKTKKSKVQLFDRWLEHPERSDAYATGFKPVGEDMYFCPVTGADMVNLYKPPKHPPIKKLDVKRFIELVDFLWQDHASTILDWCAHIVQNPEKRPHWAPMIITPEEGMGKNIFARILANVIGPSNMTQIEASQFVKTFNTFLVQNQVVVLNEVEELAKLDRAAIGGKLKKYITDGEQTIEGKGRDLYDTQIFCVFIIMTNAIDALQMNTGSRRYFVHVNECKPQTTEWYKYITTDLEEMSHHVYWFLMQRDVSSFKWYGDAPMTVGKEIVEKESHSAETWMIIDAIEHFESVFVSDIITKESWNYYISKVFSHRMSAAQSRFIQKKLLTPIKTKSGASRQLRGMPTISDASDKSLMVEGTPNDEVMGRKVTAWTCRRHGMYDDADPGTIREEYSKIFNINQTADVMKLVG